MTKKQSYDDIIKDFSTLLLICAGPPTYEFIQSNCKGGIPSVPTVRRYLHTKSIKIRKGEFRFDGLQRHLELYNVSILTIAISEDATRVIAKVDYDPEYNTLIGLVCPCDENGIPIADIYRFTNFDSVKDILENAEKAKLVYTFIAQPLQQHVPSFCLALFGTNIKFDSEDVLRRWEFINSECIKRKTAVISFAADGDPKS